MGGARRIAKGVQPLPSSNIAVKLRMVGYAIAPLRDWNAKDFEFEDDIVERLAKEEHDRWNRERVADGWTYVGLVDDGTEEAQQAIEDAKRRKATPYLVPFEELPTNIADYDRTFVRKSPACSPPWACR